MKTSELSGHALNWAVAKCEGEKAELNRDEIVTWKTVNFAEYRLVWNPSTNWVQGGAIIEREGISIVLDDDIDDYSWTATCIKPPYVSAEQGSTPLIAAMRCYVSSKLGEEVDIQEMKETN